ncbi:hypothetical protein PPL_11554 [Heterostelium album PN500]|uniref:Uncharacterized protein n=1 Tax=Heterostelium pallidum (strain ATCC 26659 / Pp 5 / PN500) TaxID=670386 RepID=D3BVG3_HETP5|nr:hypothetical protein PPL_11554 [Heterostelium album PN500]EFA74586.1 hypothetical protein PPL_11554 [Heterostelium album PN500]|eukprot:XP_020426720.1 hypothetical protein PPL_11554 [Heterostelium album PN500]
MTDVEDKSTMERKKIDKLQRLTGRRESITKIQSLLNPKSLEEAQINTQKLETNEKLTHIFGERPECR